MAEICEIETAVRSFEESRLPLHLISPTNFPLPNLERKLREARVYIHEGEGGFVIFRGMNPKCFTAVQNVIAHAGLSSYVGNKRAMAGSEAGDYNVLHHVTSLEADEGEFRGMANQTVAIPFHTDPGHILSLFMVSKSEFGGSLYLARVSQVYEKIATTMPDLIDVLLEDWAIMPVDLDADFESRPLLFFSGSRPIISCIRSRVLGTGNRPRPASLPPITSMQYKALDAIEKISRELSTRIDQEPGDLTLVNNLAFLHARDSFQDNPQNGFKRHLLHLMLRDNELSWKLPKELEVPWRVIYDHQVKDEVFSVKEILFSFAGVP